VTCGHGDDARNKKTDTRKTEEDEHLVCRSGIMRYHSCVCHARLNLASIYSLLLLITADVQKLSAQEPPQ